MAAPRIAIAGGGLAGLAAGVELKNAGFTVDLFERARLLGGRATSFELDGHVVDNGQHVFLACCTAFIAFVAKIGMRDSLYMQDRFDVRVFSRKGCSRMRARDLPAPLSLFASLVRYRHLGTAAKLQVVRAILAIALNPAGARGDMSFAQWLHERGQGAQAIGAFWEPFLVPALNAPLDRMNAAEATFVISTAFLRDRDAARFGYALVPLASIMDAAAARLDRVHRATAVAGIELVQDGVALRTARGETLHFDAAVLAVSPRALARIVGKPDDFGIGSLDAYESAAIVDVHLWHDAGRLEFDFAAILDSPVQWVFQKAEGYLCCSLSAADAFVAQPSEAVVERIWTEIRAVIPNLARARLQRGAVTRNPEGTYLMKAGGQRTGAATASPRIAVAGAWTDTGWPDTMESAVRSGVRAAAIAKAACRSI